MAEEDPEIKRRNRFFDITIGVFAVAAIVLSALIILSLPGSVTTGLAVGDASLLTGSKGSDDALYFSYLINQHGRIDERIFESYEQFSDFQDHLNFVYASSDMGQMEMHPLEISEDEFSSRAFLDRYYLVIPAYNKMAESAAEVASGNTAADERFLVDFYSFELYLEGLSSGTYWRASELPGYGGLAELRTKYGDGPYQKVLLNSYNLLLQSDPNMPSYKEWI